MLYKMVVVLDVLKPHSCSVPDAHLAPPVSGSTRGAHPVSDLRVEESLDILG